MPISPRPRPQFRPRPYRQNGRSPHQRRLFDDEEDRTPATAEQLRIDQPPNGGRPIIDIDDLLGMSYSLGSGRIVYENADESVRYAKRDAEKMRRDPVIESALNERIAPVALLDWHLECDEANSNHPIARQMCDELREILLRTPRLSSLIQSLSTAIWHGKAGVSNSFDWDALINLNSHARRRCLRVVKWEPIHGDSIVPDSEGKIGFKVRRGLNHLTDNQRRRIESTIQGPVLFLDEQDLRERSYFVIHQHRFEAAPFDDARRAGVLHGVGLRDRCFWVWKQKNTAMTWLFDYLERFGNGVNLWYYEMGDDTSRKEVKRLAESQSGRVSLLVPRPIDSNMQGPGFEHIQIGGTGSDKLFQIVGDYFDAHIRRLIVGQNLSSESASTGLGSGVAALQRETKQNLILLDAYNLAETLTTDLVHPLARHNARYFPHWPRGLRPRWVFEVEDKNVQGAIEMAERLNAIGAKFDVDDLRDRAGLNAPSQGGSVNPGPPQTPTAPPGLPMSRLKRRRSVQVRLDCGAGSDGSPGFKPGNDCGGKSGGSGDGGQSKGQFWEAAMDPSLPGAGISVAPSGQIKIKKPKNAQQAIKQLDAAQTLRDAAIKHSEAAQSLPANSPERVKAGLLALHAEQQFQRVQRNAEALLRTVQSKQARLDGRSGRDADGDGVFDERETGKRQTTIAGDVEAFELVSKELLGTSDPDQVAAVLGAPEGSEVQMREANGEIVGSYSVDGGRIIADRSIYRDDDGQLVVVNERIRKKSGPRGEGTRIFRDQVLAAEKMGVDRIEMSAAGYEGDPRYNGYYSWAVMGVDGPLARASLQDRESIAEKYPTAVTVLDIIESPGGAEDWKRYGGSYWGVFDLKNQRQRERLDYYVKQILPE